MSMEFNKLMKNIASAFSHNELALVGNIITGSDIRGSIIGVRSIIRANTRIRNSIVMGADDYESHEDQLAKGLSGLPPIGIGEKTFKSRK